MLALAGSMTAAGKTRRWRPSGPPTTTHETRVNLRHETPPTGPPASLPSPRLAAQRRPLWLLAAWCTAATASAQMPDERTLLGDVPSVFAFP